MRPWVSVNKEHQMVYKPGSYFLYDGEAQNRRPAPGTLFHL